MQSLPTTTAPAAPRAQLPQSVSGLPDPGERVPAMAWPTVALYVGTLALFAVEMAGVLVWGLTPWLTVPMGAAVTFLMFSVLHESTHHAISTHTRANNALGHLSVLLVVPWATYPLVKFIHIEHHRNTNEPKSIDPDAWCEEGPAWQLPLRWATIDIWYVVFYLSRLRDRPRREVAATFTLFTAVIGGFVAIAAAGYGSELFWAFLLPQRIGMLILAWWFDYLPHHGLTVTQREDKYRATRVRVGGEGLLTPLFVYQNYHLVHHLHPSIPFYRYIRAWRRNEQAYLDRNAAISTWFGRSLTPSEYRTWRRLTDEITRRPTFHPLRVRAVEPVSSDAVAITFDVPDDLVASYRYVQGQHLTLRAVIDGEEVRRSYSLVAPVASDGPGTLRVAVKHVPGGQFSTYVNERLVAGDLLDVMTPAGAFHVRLDPAAVRHHVGVVAGSGVTPLMSTIATTLDAEPDSRFTLVYGNRTAASTMFADELAAWQDRYGERLVVHHVRSRETAPGVVPGRITPALVAELVPDAAGVAAWFLCGPQEMVDDVRDALGRVPGTGQVLTEVFHVVAGPALALPDITSQVTVALDGTETTFPLTSTGDSVLDAALQRGIDPPYSCAGGACGTCRAKVVLGQAVMDQNHVLDEDEVADGYVLTCQAHPVTEELRVDYDA
ncbi:fatty acid desaturase [Pimelobacter simplex]|uniref:fatty acid desaturase n=1 Tax=Nocardioides simplex TaxID=2045 RepID=UPI00214F90CF|nr:fatty acid desaturase [Pimelobacter simplex]UUW90712.1 fatty acid desaturase [Pimelobacter simplex]UUW94541.1 fatty acid desaturase [Pimelobacter simplex]